MLLPPMLNTHPSTLSRGVLESSHVKSHQGSRNSWTGANSSVADGGIYVFETFGLGREQLVYVVSKKKPYRSFVHAIHNI